MSVHAPDNRGPTAMCLRDPPVGANYHRCYPPVAFPKTNKSGYVPEPRQVEKSKQVGHRVANSTTKMFTKLQVYHLPGAWDVSVVKKEMA
jgi:hypothetical protein